MIDLNVHDDLILRAHLRVRDFFTLTLGETGALAQRVEYGLRVLPFLGRTCPLPHSLQFVVGIQ